MSMDKINPFETKVWGLTRCDYTCEHYSHHTLRVKAGGVCSVHYHKARSNKFKVISGRLAIVELYGWKSTKTVLGPGEEYVVPSLVPHQFQALCDGQIVEEYLADRGRLWISLEDIVRLSQGFLVTDLKRLQALEGPALQKDFQ